MKRVQPAPPKDVQGKSVHGSVVMLMHLNTLGHVRDLYVLGGDQILASAAVQAVSHWEYKPFMLNDEPINVETQVTVNFE
ncbi:MAG: energy transducer TonB [Candidatus Sulfotelmatobacter sp.]